MRYATLLIISALCLCFFPGPVKDAQAGNTEEFDIAYQDEANDVVYYYDIVDAPEVDILYIEADDDGKKTITAKMTLAARPSKEGYDTWDQCLT